ncbi:hypothetical protein [Hirschia maritima]|uniref:hypothetical protein n=1 Tax=Hirschia maritima TaxID=1121961 RepID=UPI0003736CE5|nr:hypothetical protein [Hirschia maritima]
MTKTADTSKFDMLIERAGEYQELAKENYDRVRRIAEGIRSGFCKYLSSKDGKCVHLVPAQGAFQPKDYGDEAFSMPPRGFRHIGPIAFGLAVRVTKGTDWLRMTLICSKKGDFFEVSIVDGDSHRFDLPFTDDDHQDFYEALFNHIVGWLDDKIELYKDGDYSSRSIGFDFSDENVAGDGLAPELPITQNIS